MSWTWDSPTLNKFHCFTFRKYALNQFALKHDVYELLNLLTHSSNA